jgi:ubiquinone/menaquinone biosynthesis C-methylase UbiE
MGLIFVVFVYWLVVIGECTYLGRYAVRFIYERGAHFYDEVRTGIQASDQELLLPRLAQALIGKIHHVTIDVATGTGRVPLLLASQPWFDGIAYGLDFSPAMLAQARLKAHSYGLAENVPFVLGESGRLPWPDAYADLVTCLEALEYFPNPQHALAEMVRVLQPGGSLVISKYPDEWARWLPGKAFSTQQLTQVLSELGLEQIVVEPWQPGHYDLVIAMKPNRQTP